MDNRAVSGPPGFEQECDVGFRPGIVAGSLFGPDRIVNGVLQVDEKQCGVGRNSHGTGPVLTPADELHDFDTGSGFKHRTCPELTADDCAVHFDGDAGGFETKGPDDIEKRGSGCDGAAFAVDRDLKYDLNFGVHRDSWFIIDFALNPT
jgi:hypothetical protein